MKLSKDSTDDTGPIITVQIHLKMRRIGLVTGLFPQYRVLRMRNLIFTILTLMISAPVSARPSQRESEKLTSVAVVHVSGFSSRNQEVSESKAREFSIALSRSLKSKSYWDVVELNQTMPLKPSKESFEKLPLQGTYDAVLLGEFRGKSLKLSLRRFPAGTTLASWTFPFDGDLKSLMSEVVTTLVNDTPYRGFVLARRGNQIKVNLGKREALEPGTELEIFEYEGKSFGSDREVIGRAKVIKVNPDAALAEISSGAEDISTHSKVAFSSKSTHVVPGASQKYFSDPWISLGGQMLYLDSQTSEDDEAMKGRHYQLTLTPFAAAAFGFGPLSFRAATGGAENASNRVTFLFAEGNWEFLGRTLDRWGFITGVGANTWQFTSQKKANATLPLNSVSTFSPHIEQAITYNLTSRSRLFLVAQLQIPKLSSDSANGSTSPVGSFGFRGEGGLRLLLSQAFGVENNIAYQYSQYTFGPGKAVLEAIFGVSVNAYYRF